MRALKLLALSLLLAGCEEEVVTNPAGVQPPPRTAQATQTTQAVQEEEQELPPAVDFQEAAFVESDRSRDPFRNYAMVFVDKARSQVRSQREVVLEQYPIDELKLIGIISGINPARAMFLDPAGVGHVVTRGQFIGRANVVQPGGGVGAAYEVNWRVDRIRDGDVVLVQDDPSNPEIPSSTRVIPLRTDEMTAEEGGAGGDDELKSELERLKERLASMEASESARRRSGSEEKSSSGDNR